MKTQPVLTDEFKDAITNLVIDDHAPGGQLAVPDNARAVLQAGLEQTLVDTDAFYDYLHYLNHTHRIRHPFRHSELLSPAIADTVVLLGLSELKPEQLAELALNPYQLAELHEQLSESEPSDVWWPIFKRFNREAALLAEVFDEHRERLEAVFSPPMQPTRDPGEEQSVHGIETEADDTAVARAADSDTVVSREDRIRQALTKVAKELQPLVELRLIRGLSEDATAQKLGWTLDDVVTRLPDAIAQFHQALTTVGKIAPGSPVEPIQPSTPPTIRPK